MHFGKALALLAVAASFAATGNADEVLTLSQTEISQLPPEAVTHRVIDQVATLLAAAPTPAFNDAAHQAANVQIARILATVPGDAAADLSAPQVRERLAGLLMPVPFAPSGPPKRLRSLYYHTHIHETAVANLCSQESLSVDFARVGDTQGVDARVTAARLFANIDYYFLKPPVSAVAVPLAAKQRVKAAAACAALEETKAKSIIASNDAGAVRGTWLLAAVVKQAATGTVPAGWTCDGQAATADCMRAIATPPVHGQIAGCAPDDATCALVLSGMFWADVTAGAGSKPQITGISARRIIPVPAYYDGDKD